MQIAAMRVARPTDDLSRIRRFYEVVVGLTPEVRGDDPDLNPYWPRSGAMTFVDPDGYRLIISPG